MVEIQDLVRKVLMLQIGPQYRNQILNQFLIEGLESLGEALAEVLRDGLQVNKDLTHQLSLLG